MDQNQNSRVLRVGLVGIGEVAQSVHLPTLGLLSHLFKVTAICDISNSTLQHCSAKFHIATTYTNVEELCADPNVDVVFILTSDEYHSLHAITALQQNKHVLVEKPVAMSLAAAQRMIDAESKSRGKVFVAYMRRYATALRDFKEELPKKEQIRLVRIRDIIGPNAHFVGQSGTFPLRFSDYPAEAMDERTTLAESLLKEVYPDHSEITPNMTRFCRFLGGLGSHDLSVMREVLGMPKVCTSAAFHCNPTPFVTATFEYEGFTVIYESGIDNVPRFDAHVQVYGQTKTVRLQYDTPFVKGLPIKVTVDEESPKGSFSTKEVIPTYEDAYTLELLDLHACLVSEKNIKTTVKDAMEDLDIFQMILKRAFPI